MKGIQWVVKICRSPTLHLPHQMLNLSSESNETCADGDISVDGSETSSSDESLPVTTMMRPAESQLDSNSDVKMAGS